jgi:hypothetical protein
MNYEAIYTTCSYCGRCGVDGEGFCKECGKYN